MPGIIPQEAKVPLVQAPSVRDPAQDPPPQRISLNFKTSSVASSQGLQASNSPITKSLNTLSNTEGSNNSSIFSMLKTSSSSLKLLDSSSSIRRAVSQATSLKLPALPQALNLPMSIS